MAWDKPAALVTGASSGIGAAFARRLARDGYRLILVARRKDRLETLAAEVGGAEVLEADLVQPADRERVEERIRNAPDLDLLVNNAGFGVQGPFFEASLDAQDQMHRLHILVTMRLAHAALAGMVARGRGAVINVSSVAGFGQSPGSVSYCATKAWMNSFTEGLHLDLRSTGSPVRVQALCPGFTVTEFQDVAGVDRKRIPAALWMTAESVVDASLKGLAAGKILWCPGGFTSSSVSCKHWCPDRCGSRSRHALAARSLRGGSERRQAEGLPHQDGLRAVTRAYSASISRWRLRRCSRSSAKRFTAAKTDF